MKILTKKEQIEIRKEEIADLISHQCTVIRRLDSQIENKMRSFFGGLDVCSLRDDKSNAERILEVLEEYLLDLPA